MSAPFSELRLCYSECQCSNRGENVVICTPCDVLFRVSYVFIFTFVCCKRTVPCQCDGPSVGVLQQLYTWAVTSEHLDCLRDSITSYVVCYVPSLFNTMS